MIKMRIKIIGMLDIRNAVDWELQRIDKSLNVLKKDKTRPAKLPVHVRSRHNRKYYYCTVVKKDVKHEVYLGKEDSEKLQVVVKQSFKAEMIKTLLYDRDLILKFREQYLPYTTESIMRRLSPCLADYRFNSDFDNAMDGMRAWAKAEYQKNETPFPQNKIYAKDGTRVRSKSECIIYNALLDAGICFRYDPVLEFTSPDPMSDGMTVVKSPDFQIICMDGSFILIEHAGKLSEKWYSDDLARKLQLYHYNGYIPGVNMFITADDKDGGFDTTAVAQLIETLRWRVYQ